MKTTRRPFLKSLFAFLGAAGISIPFLSFTSRVKSDGFAHVVYFWLKNPENESIQKQFLANSRSYLKQIDLIQSMFIGKPSSSERDVVDGSFTFSFVLMFKDKKDQDKYQDHPAHQDFVNKSEEMWEKVVVYDSIPA